MERHNSLLAPVESDAPKVDTPIVMKDATIDPPMTDEQYQAEAESLFAQMRLMNDQSEREWTRIEQLRAETQRALTRMEAIAARLEAR